MRISTIIRELADQPYRYGQTKRTPQQDVYQFQTSGGSIYRVIITKTWTASSNISQPSQLSEIEVGFSHLDPERDQESVGITGTGDAYRVFATVRDILSQYIQSDTPPAHITFSGKSSEPSRVNLYQRIARTAQRWLPGYHKSQEEQDQDSYYFRLSRQRDPRTPPPYQRPR